MKLKVPTNNVADPHNFHADPVQPFRQCWGSGSGFVFLASRIRSHKYGSRSVSGSFHHRAKIVRKTWDFYCFVTSLCLFIFAVWCKKYQCSESAYGSICFWASRSAFASVSQRYGSEDPDLHPDLYQNVTDPQHCSQVTKLNFSWLRDVFSHLQSTISV